MRSLQGGQWHDIIVLLDKSGQRDSRGTNEYSRQQAKSEIRDSVPRAWSPKQCLRVPTFGVVAALALRQCDT